MTKREIFKLELYSLAKQALEMEQLTGEPTTYTSYIIDTTFRSEKMHIRENIKRLEDQIPRDKKLGLETKVYEKMLQICKDRMKRITEIEKEDKTPAAAAAPETEIIRVAAVTEDPAAAAEPITELHTGLTVQPGGVTTKKVTMLEYSKKGYQVTRFIVINPDNVSWFYFHISDPGWKEAKLNGLNQDQYWKDTPLEELRSCVKGVKHFNGHDWELYIDHESECDYFNIYETEIEIKKIDGGGPGVDWITFTEDYGDEMIGNLSRINGSIGHIDAEALYIKGDGRKGFY